jgi:hypothetical protein
MKTMKKIRMRVGGEPTTLVPLEEVEAIIESRDHWRRLAESSSPDEDLQAKIDQLRADLKTAKALMQETAMTLIMARDERDKAIKQRDEFRATVNDLRGECRKLTKMVEDEMLDQDGAKAEVERLRGLLYEIRAIAAKSRR